MGEENFEVKIEYLEKANKKLKQEIQKLRQTIKNYKYDTLTGLLRRSDFNDRFDELFYEHKEFGHRFILAMVDLNGLHEINRDVSFEAGDEFIIHVANQLKELFEDSNIFRIGGDEFMLLKRGNDIEDFDKRLELIEDCETFSVTTQDGYECESEMFNAVDDGIIAKKQNRKRD
jgi:diguanylate cyclase (GGDEF)-like protein